MTEKHIDDFSCRECVKYSCNFIITQGKGKACKCSCHNGFNDKSSPNLKTTEKEQCAS